jgi:hypothetical protein
MIVKIEMCKTGDFAGFAVLSRKISGKIEKPIICCFTGKANFL